jgi:penicillin-binding protein 2D
MRGRLLIGAVVAITCAGAYAAYRVVSFTRLVALELSGAADVAQLRRRPQSTIVLDRRGNPAFTFYAERRTDVGIDRVSRRMVDAMLAVEDKRFHSHYGLDPIRIAGAAWRNLRARRIAEGGSTITQQLARADRLTGVRTFERKLREAAIAVQLERRYSKAQILQEYLNTVYFGEGLYGVEAAARGYFGKAAADLDVAEAALLAAIVRAPSTDAPGVSPERARRRRDLVLRLMRQQDLLSDAEHAAAVATKLPDRSRRTHADASADGYFQEEVRRQLVRMFGADRVLRGGLRVHSTFDPELQRAAEIVIRARVQEIAKSRRGAADLQGSLVALDPATGDVLALVGGRDFKESSFNRATQAHRQAGSAFKPILYAAALERGYAPGSMLRELDVPIETTEGAWLPSGEHEENVVTLRRSLKVSSNRAAAQLLRQVGLHTTVDYAHRLGITSPLPMVPSLALGTGEVTLLELTAAYGAFAHQGLRATPRLITRVEDADGRLAWAAPTDTVRAVSPTTAFLMSSMLSDVVTGGTATGVRAAGFTLPAAGKTGTTDDYADAWFIGYTPNLVTGVWFGLDTPAPIMRRGFAGTVAVPAWARFMKAATHGAKAQWYDVPADVEKVSICRASGGRAGAGCLHQGGEIAWSGGGSWSVDIVAPLPPRQPPIFEDYFPRGFVSDELCPLHNPAVNDVAADPSAAIPLAGSGEASPTGTSGRAPGRQQEVVVERRLRPDGSVAVVMRGGGVR